MIAYELYERLKICWNRWHPIFRQSLEWLKIKLDFEGTKPLFYRRIRFNQSIEMLPFQRNHGSAWVVDQWSSSIFKLPFGGYSRYSGTTASYHLKLLNLVSCLFFCQTMLWIQSSALSLSAMSIPLLKLWLKQVTPWFSVVYCSIYSSYFA